MFLSHQEYLPLSSSADKSKLNILLSTFWLFFLCVSFFIEHVFVMWDVKGQLVWIWVMGKLNLIMVERMDVRHGWGVHLWAFLYDCLMIEHKMSRFWNYCWLLVLYSWITWSIIRFLTKNWKYPVLCFY